MATLEDYRNERLRKLAEIKELGIDPYPAKSYRSNQISQVLEQFVDFEGKTVTLAGRIVAIRSFGKLAFIKIHDYSGEIQIFMTTKNLMDCFPLNRSNYLIPVILSKRPARLVKARLVKFPFSPMPCVYSQKLSVHYQAVTASLIKKSAIVAVTSI